MIQLSFLMTASIISFAQTPTSYPRTILICEMTEGVAELSEVQPGTYNYVGSYGFDGASAGGEAKIDLTKKAGNCTLKISAGEGSRKISRSFSWTIPIDPSGVPNSLSQDSSEDGTCRFKQRYSKSFSQCVLPTPTEPGTQCYGEGGKDLTTTLPTGNSALKRKLTGYSGGMTIEIDPGSQRGISVWKDPKNEKSWCYQLKTLFPYQCKKLETPHEIKNAENRIIGILEPQGEQILFKQAKQPYSESGYEIDSSAPSVRLRNSKTETQVIALGKNGAETGRLTILGNLDLPTRFRSFNRPTVSIVDGSKVTSDCNGVISPASQNGEIQKNPSNGLR